MEKRKISIRLESHLYSSLVELQETLDISVSTIVRSILDDYIKLYKLNKLKTDEE